MHRGYVKVYRKSLDKGWVRNHKLWSVWTYCLMKATHKKTETIIGMRVVKLEPGQFIFGLKVASKDLDIPKTTIYRILKFLSSEGNLSIKSENKFSIITIMNWECYQDTRNQNGKQVENKRKTSGNIQEFKALKNKDIRKKIFKPPSLEDVILYCEEKGFDAVLANRAFEHYNIADWHDTNGKKVKNWKQKINTNWLKHENKRKPNKNGADAFAV